MNFQGREMLNAPPRPDPLPQGEGTGSERFLIFGRTSCESGPKFSTETANASPSPGGEGRREGGR
jgi:hypothetical protein